MTRLIFLLSLVISSCATQQSVVAPVEPVETLEQKANRLAQEFIITDGHVDLPYRLKIQNFRLAKEYLGIPIETDDGDFDYKRAKEGGLDAPFMSIYLPSNLQQEEGASRRLADSLITMVAGIASAHPTYFEVAYNVKDVERIAEQGKIALPMGMENGSGIEDDISLVRHFKDRGISYITLTHAKDNLICDSSYDTTGTWKGLSPYGEDVVKEMNRVGIMVDISHVSDRAFYDVMELTDVPVIASHSSVRKYTPGFERNMDDAMIQRLGEENGVIQINFGSSFLDKAIADRIDDSRSELAALLEEKGLSWRDEEAKPIMDQYQKDHPVLMSDVEMVANHIDHVVSIAGIDAVGLGSDYDGVGDTLPTGLKDVSQYPNLIKVLLERGYSDEDIAKICYKNVFRVWSAVENYAKIQEIRG